MTLGEFITKFSHNNTIRLVYNTTIGHITVAPTWDIVTMDHDITNQKGYFRHYVNNEVLGVASIYVCCKYPEAINIIIEKLEQQPMLKDLGTNVLNCSESIDL